jgi:thermitase
MKASIVRFLFKNKQFMLIIPALFLLFIILLIRSCVSGGSASDFEFEKSAELLVDLKDKSQADELKDLLEKYDAIVLQAFPQVQDTEITELDDFYTVDVKDQSVAEKVITEINKSGLADWVEYNETYQLSPIEQKDAGAAENNKFVLNSLNDPFIPKLWGFELMDIDKLASVLNKKKTKKKAKIFILDTGVDAGHEDLDDNYVSLSKKYDEDTGLHGTHCAGIAGAVSNNKKGIASLNFNGDYTSITSIIVLPGGFGTQEAIIDGMILAADNGADVISMSLGGPSSDKRQRAYNQAIEYVNKKGAIVVVAAGNSNQNALKHVPASCKGVITVSAVDKELNKASFSNTVEDIDFKIAAPGVNIFSTTPNDEYKALNGTSMATPYVAGLIGLMKSFKPSLTTEEAWRILNSTGRKTKDNQKTGKFIQPLAAMSKLVN